MSLPLLTRRVLTILIGMILATLIIAQQIGSYIGWIKSTQSFLLDTQQPNLWIMDPGVTYADDEKPVKNFDLNRVKSISGVAWAVPLSKGSIDARFNEQLITCTVIGIDDATLIGGPTHMILGDLNQIRNSDAVIMDIKSAKEIRKMIPAFSIGSTFEINEQRAELVGLCKLHRPYFSSPVIYTSYSDAIEYTNEPHPLNFILAHSLPDQDPKILAKKIERITNLKALTTKEFKNMTKNYFLEGTTTHLNLFLGLSLGFLIALLSARNFYFLYRNSSFPNDSTFFHASILAFIGWGIGIGIASLLSLFSSFLSLNFILPLWLFILSGFFIFFILQTAAFFAIKNSAMN